MTDHRSGVILALVDALRANVDLARVQVEPGWMGGDQAREAIWVGDVKGTMTVPASGPARIIGDDRFTIQLEVRVSGESSNDAAHARLAAALCRFKATRVVVSYYAHERLAELYPGWRVVPVAVPKNLAVRAGAEPAPEVLLINQP